ncbi:TRAP transporter substrate-binding protein [Celeribacter baekdonensis]|uniref:C4-dicarboxylate ABC transporter n=1 Tax=Celeribacter baekdonensis TaxID=875171 RepID=A0A2R4LY00_9RHOB|nr:TRAP transporter substrate-binding protein [Celeribacter baekdonensis]AVW89732.1 C4-dicarboxylate ABC transporter [Celeribacter baekdonensis]
MKRTHRLIAPALALCLALGAGAATEARELKLSTPTPEPHIMTKSGRHMAEAFATVGADDTIEVFPANKLGDVPTVLSLLQSGAIEFAIIPVGDLANRDPSFLAWFLPYQFATLEEAGQAAKSAPAQEMLARLDAQGIKGLGYVFPGQRHLLSTRPITSVAEMSGLKVRAFPNDIFNAWWRELGAAPTALPLPEIMPSLVTGVIDAVDVDIDIVMGLQMQKQAPHLVLTNHMAFPAAILASGRWWNSLSPEEQAQVSKIVSQTQDWAIATQTTGEAAILAKLAADGTDITTLDDLILAEAGEKVRDAFLDRDPLIRRFYEANQN